MCGLFGVLTYPGSVPERTQLIRMFNALAVHSIARGRHASGMAVVDRTQGLTTIVKDNVPANIMVDTEAWKTALNQVTPETAALLGHTRHATHGANTPGNAHPFVFDHEKLGALVGTHNGVIFNHDELSDTPARFESDSANLFDTLSSCVDPIHMVRLLENVLGTYALVFHRGDTLYFVRNGSPLWISKMWVGDVGVLLYASTPEFLRRVASSFYVRHTVPVVLNDNQLYVVNVHTLEEVRFPYTPRTDLVSLKSIFTRKQPRLRASNR